MPMILLSAYTWLEDFAAVEREAARALAATHVSEPVKLVAVPGARASALFESGRLNLAADWARAAETKAKQLRFQRHFFALDYLRTLAGLALERRDLDAADDLTEQAMTIVERRRPTVEFQVLLNLKTACADGHLNTVITTAPQLTRYLVEHLSQMQPDPYLRCMSEAAMAVRDGREQSTVTSGGLIEPLTDAELQVLRLLPTSSYQQIAATLYVSRNTVKTHLRAIYRKLGVASRSDAIARALELCLL